MARGQKAVEGGSIRRQPTRNCRQNLSAEAAASSDVAKPSLPMDATNTKAKKNPRRAAKDRYEEEKLMTSEKSQLIDLDLVRLLALPEAWSCLEEDEKKKILDLLPSDTHPNPNPPPEDPEAKIPPLPEEFLRYSNNWRDGIRHFQLDLQNGRYDPVWMREAEEAVQQRAAGKFDKFKEQEFEEFWGQKQKMDRALTAGESSRIKVSTLIEHGVIRKGDIWKWSRSFGRKKDLLIEKEARIIDINGALLTFLIPPGQRIFLKAADADANSSAKEDEPESHSNTPPLSPPNDEPKPDVKPDSDEQETETGSSRKRSAEPDIEVTSAKRARGRPRKRQPSPVEEKASNLAVEVVNPQLENGEILPASETKPDVDSSAEVQQNGISQTNGEQQEDATPGSLAEPMALDDGPVQEAPEANGESDEIIAPDVQGPTALTLKILKIDGRIKKPTNGNAWKELRCFRDNQDMGTLWEVRQAWFVKKK